MYQSSVTYGYSARLLLVVLSAQPVLAMLDYFSDGASSAINAVFLFLLIALYFSNKTISNAYGFVLTTLLVVCLTSAAIYQTRFPESGVGFFPPPLIKLFFLICLLQLGQLLFWESNGSKLFEYVAPIVILLVFFSQLLGYYIGVEAVAEDYEFAFVGVAKHPAITANLVLGILPIALMMAFRGKDYWLFFAFILIALTFRRSALICASFFILAYMLFLFKSGKRTLLSSLFICGLLASPFLLAILHGDVIELITSRISDLGFDNRSSESLGAGRSVFWKIAINQLFYGEVFDFYFGYGYGSLADLLYMRFGMAIGAHNDFIDFAFAYGIVAGFLLVLVYLVFFVSGAKISDLQDRIILCTTILAMLFLSATSGGVFEPTFAPAFALFGYFIIKDNTLKNERTIGIG